MPRPPFATHPPNEDMATLLTQLVEELTRKLMQESPGASVEPAAEAAEDLRRHALLRLQILAGVKLAARRLEDQAAHAAAASGAGYPEIGRALSMSRQGARRRWPGLITNSTAHPAPRPTPWSS
ncbi:hypothetical protein [Streptomyces sp. MAI_2237]